MGSSKQNVNAHMAVNTMPVPFVYWTLNRNKQRLVMKKCAGSTSHHIAGGRERFSFSLAGPLARDDTKGPCRRVTSSVVSVRGPWYCDG